MKHHSLQGLSYQHLHFLPKHILLLQLLSSISQSLMHNFLGNVCSWFRDYVFAGIMLYSNLKLLEHWNSRWNGAHVALTNTRRNLSFVVDLIRFWLSLILILNTRTFSISIGRKLSFFALLCAKLSHFIFAKYKLSLTNVFFSSVCFVGGWGRAYILEPSLSPILHVFTENFNWKVFFYRQKTRVNKLVSMATNSHIVKKA